MDRAVTSGVVLPRRTECWRGCRCRAVMRTARQQRLRFRLALALDDDRGTAEECSSYFGSLYLYKTQTP